MSLKIAEEAAEAPPPKVATPPAKQTLRPRDNINTLVLASRTSFQSQVHNNNKYLLYLLALTINIKIFLF